jgi:hypothetical protein
MRMIADTRINNLPLAAAGVSREVWPRSMWKRRECPQISVGIDRSSKLTSLFRRSRNLGDFDHHSRSDYSCSAFLGSNTRRMGSGHEMAEGRAVEQGLSNPEG